MKKSETFTYFLNEQEKSELDAVARSMGISRAKVIRELVHKKYSEIQQKKDRPDLRVVSGSNRPTLQVIKGGKP